MKTDSAVLADAGKGTEKKTKTTEAGKNALAQSVHMGTSKTPSSPVRLGKFEERKDPDLLQRIPPLKTDPKGSHSPLRAVVARRLALQTKVPQKATDEAPAD